MVSVEGVRYKSKCERRPCCVGKQREILRPAAVPTYQPQPTRRSRSMCASISLTLATRSASASASRLARSRSFSTCGQKQQHDVFCIGKGVCDQHVHAMCLCGPVPTASRLARFLSFSTCSAMLSIPVCAGGRVTRC